jgi:hypothetical protein
MAEATDTETPTVASWQRPIGLTVTVFLISLALLLVSLLIRWPVDAGQLLYDLGIGVGIATAISIVVTQHLDKLDQAEKDRREAARRALEQTENRLLRAQAEREREIKEREEQIFSGLQDLDRRMAETLQGLRSEALAGLVEKQGIAIAGLHADVRQIRSKVDPAYTHPHAALVDQLMELLQDAADADTEGGDDEATARELRTRVDALIRAHLHDEP